MRKPFLIVSLFILFSGGVLIMVGALAKIQSWNISPWVLTAGVIISLLGTIGSIFSVLKNQSKPTAETQLKLEDLPETVEEAEVQLRRDENMIL